MATRVQQASNVSSDSTSVTVTFSAASANNLLIGVYCLRGTFGGVGTPSGWSLATSLSNNGNTASPELAIFYKVAAGGETSVTFTDGAASTCNMIAFVDEWSGIVSTSPLDKTATGDSTTTAVTSLTSGTTATLVQANEFCLAAWAVRGVVSSPSYSNSFTADGFQTNNTQAAAPVSLLIAELTVASTSAVSSTASWTTSGRAIGAIATFKESAAVGQPYIKRVGGHPFAANRNIGSTVMRF